MRYRPGGRILPRALKRRLPDMALELALHEVARSYGARTVISDISFAMSSGMAVLMGPNGSGKSTLMRLCAMIEEPTSGLVSFMEEGRALPKDEALRRRVTMVLSRGGIFNASVCRNAAYGLRIRGVRGKELAGRVHAMLERVGLLKKTKQNALSLSSGETQRLALARAMLIEPDVLLLDEPTASVDEGNTAIIEALILDLIRPGGPLVIMSTHDRAQAQRILPEDSKGLLFISQGKLSAGFF